MYITRDEAVHVIYDVMNSGIIDSRLEDSLQDIANCIEHENDNLFLWGADNEVTDLFIGKRADLITDEWIKHCEDLYEKYKIREIEPEKYDEEE